MYEMTEQPEKIGAMSVRQFIESVVHPEDAPRLNYALHAAMTASALFRRWIVALLDFDALFGRELARCRQRQIGVATECQFLWFSAYPETEYPGRGACCRKGEGQAIAVGFCERSSFPNPSPEFEIR